MQLCIPRNSSVKCKGKRVSAPSFIYNFSCFLHIVNLAVKTVLDNITKIELAAADAQEFDFAIAQQPDSIAQLCTIVRRVCIFFKSISNIFIF